MTSLLSEALGSTLTTVLAGVKPVTVCYTFSITTFRSWNLAVIVSTLLEVYRI